MGVIMVFHDIIIDHDSFMIIDREVTWFQLVLHQPLYSLKILYYYRCLYCAYYYM